MGLRFKDLNWDLGLFSLGFWTGNGGWDIGLGYGTGNRDWDLGLGTQGISAMTAVPTIGLNSCLCVLPWRNEGKVL